MQIKNWYVLVILTVILTIGVMLRNYNLNTWPREGATFDEYAWTFLGLSIINTGVPTSWSPHPQYTHKQTYINPHGTNFQLVTPYLEHPPLFGLVAGIFARIHGVTDFNGVEISKIRPLALFLGTVAIIAVYLFSQSVYGRGVGLLSAFLYAIIPSVAVGSRLIQNENFFIPLFLLSLYFLHRYLITSGKHFFIFALLISPLLPLAKIPWISAPLAMVAILFYVKKYKEAMIIVASTGIVIFLFVLYGTHYDAKLFQSLWMMQLSRYDMGFESLFALFTLPVLTDRLFLDGWIFFGWIAWFMSTKNLKKNYPLIFGLIVYGSIFIFAIPNEPGHGWYRYPFYPFLTIATAVFIKDYFNKELILTTIFLLVIGLSMFYHVWTPVFGFSYLVFRLYLVACSIGLLPIWFPTKQVKKISFSMNWLLLGLASLLSTIAVIGYNEQ